MTEAGPTPQPPGPQLPLAHMPPSDSFSRSAQTLFAATSQPLQRSPQSTSQTGEFAVTVSLPKSLPIGRQALRVISGRGARRFVAGRCSDRRNH